jgi:hypothetical protein
LAIAHEHHSSSAANRFLQSVLEAVDALDAAQARWQWFAGKHTSTRLQVVVLCARCWKYHQDTRKREVQGRLAGVTLTIDAVIWGALHAVMFTSMPLAGISLGR